MDERSFCDWRRDDERGIGCVDRDVRRGDDVMKGRYLALFALAPLLSQCAPDGCTPRPGEPGPTTTTTVAVTYDWAVYGFCDDTPDDTLIEIENTGTGTLWIEGDTQSTPPGDSVDIWWPVDNGVPADTMDVTYLVDTSTGSELATETYVLAEMCAP
jgi:hypothetical protein